jgi:hypothetical protein
MSESPLKAAEYFERRAQRARTPEDRARFLALVQKYRTMATQNQQPVTASITPRPMGLKDPWMK